MHVNMFVHTQNIENELYYMYFFLRKNSTVMIVTGTHFVPSLKLLMLSYVMNIYYGGKTRRLKTLNFFVVSSCSLHSSFFIFLSFLIHFSFLSRFLYGFSLNFCLLHSDFPSFSRFFVFLRATKDGEEIRTNIKKCPTSQILNSPKY